MGIVKHKHILRGSGKTLMRVENSFKDEPIYVCDVCAREFAMLPDAREVRYALPL